jgi:uncharacterized protein HemX
LILTAVAAAALAPAALAATTTPQPAPGSPFSQPVQPLVGEPTQTETTVTSSGRAGDTNSGRGTLLLLSLVALAMIAGVGGYIWYESRHTRTAAKRRRQRLRSGRTPQPIAAASGTRRGPPPPPRKRRAQAKRKKR